MRIVVADDHKVYRHATKAMLENVPGLTVVGEAADGREAVRLAGELAPDLLVTDIVMPELNGIEATRRIVAACPGVRVIGLSLHDDSYLVEAMLAAGASGYVLKDCASSELVTAVHTVAAGGTFISVAIRDPELG